MYEVFRHIAIPWPWSSQLCQSICKYTQPLPATLSCVHLSPWCISYMYKWNLKVAQINTTWVAVYWCSLHIGRLVVNIRVQCHKPTPSHQCNECVIRHRLLHCVFIVLTVIHIWIYTCVVGVLWSFSRIFWRRDDARSTVFHYFYIELVATFWG